MTIQSRALEMTVQLAQATAEMSAEVGIQIKRDANLILRYLVEADGQETTGHSLYYLDKASKSMTQLKDCLHNLGTETAGVGTMQLVDDVDQTLKEMIHKIIH